MTRVRLSELKEGKSRRKFNGRTYVLDSLYAWKQYAQQRAKELRRKGWLVRVVYVAYFTWGVYKRRSD